MAIFYKVKRDTKATCLAWRAIAGTEYRRSISLLFGAYRAASAHAWLFGECCPAASRQLSIRSQQLYPRRKLETHFEAIEQQTGNGQSRHTGYQPLTAELYYFQTDLLGTPLEVTDSEGNLVWVGQYRAPEVTLQI